MAYELQNHNMMEQRSPSQNSQFSHIIIQRNISCVEHKYCPGQNRQILQTASFFTNVTSKKFYSQSSCFQNDVSCSFIMQQNVLQFPSFNFNKSDKNWGQLRFLKFTIENDVSSLQKLMYMMNFSFVIKLCPLGKSTVDNLLKPSSSISVGLPASNATHCTTPPLPS